MMVCRQRLLNTAVAHEHKTYRITQRVGLIELREEQRDCLMMQDLVHPSQRLDPPQAARRSGSPIHAEDGVPARARSIRPTHSCASAGLLDCHRMRPLCRDEPRKHPNMQVAPKYQAASGVCPVSMGQVLIDPDIVGRLRIATSNRPKVGAKRRCLANPLGQVLNVYAYQSAVGQCNRHVKNDMTVFNVAVVDHRCSLSSTKALPLYHSGCQPALQRGCEACEAKTTWAAQ